MSGYNHELPSLSTIPVKSGFGPSTWFLTHNVDYSALTIRQWCYLKFHFLSAFAVCYYLFSFFQDIEASFVDQPEAWKGYKGMWAMIFGLLIYFLFPHRMIHFHEQMPYSEYVDQIKEMQAQAKACYQPGSLSEAFSGAHAAQHPRKKKPCILGGKRRHKHEAASWILPDWFQTYGIGMDHLEYKQWCFFFWNWGTAFLVCYNLLSWFQEAGLIDNREDAGGYKGLVALAISAPLFWLVPHRMYHFHEEEPGSNCIFPEDGEDMDFLDKNLDDEKAAEPKDLYSDTMAVETGIQD